MAEVHVTFKDLMYQFGHYRNLSNPRGGSGVLQQQPNGSMNHSGWISCRSLLDEVNMASGARYAVLDLEIAFF